MNPQSSPDQPVRAPIVPETPQHTAVNRLSHKKLLIISGIVAIFLLAGVAALILLRGNSAVSPGSLTQAEVNGHTHAAIDTSSIGNTYDSYAGAGVADFSADKKQATLAALQSLSSRFGLAQTSFQDKATALIALGIARGSLDHPAQADGYHNALYLLFADQLTAVPSGITDEYFVAPKTSDTQVPTVLAEYTDQADTAQLKGVMQSSGVEAEAAKNLGLSGVSALAPYTPLVMNFTTGSSAQTKFGAENYMFGANPKMWVQSTSTTTYLVMTKDYGEAFLRAPSGDERSTVIHELIHTQHAFVRGDLGHAIEERRAELFSGDKSAYFDTKQLFTYTQVLSGFSPLDLMREHGTNSDDFYLGLYSALGVDGANAFVVSAPNVFLIQPSTAVQKAQSAFGGMDGVIKVAIKIGSADKTAMAARMKARTETLLKVFGTKQQVLDDLSNSLDQTYNMPTAAQAMENYIKTH